MSTALRISVLSPASSDEAEVQVVWKRSARARRISLRVSRLDGQVTLTLPQRASLASGETFLAERRQWLRAALRGIEPVRPVAEGGEIEIEGVRYQIARGAVRKVTRAEGQLILPKNGRTGALIANWLKLEARERAAQSIAHHAAALGRAAGKLRLADPKGRWGSCTSSGDIMLSWRLLLAPEGILDYVAAHEVAHLAEMNHSPKFWAVLARLLPDYPQKREWLRQNGAALHRISFEPEAEA